MATKKESKKKTAPQIVGDDWEFIDEVLESDAVRTGYSWGRPGNGKTHAAMTTGLRGRRCT